MKHVSVMTALLLAAVCGLSWTGCSSEPSYEESELPYGATMRENKTSYAVPMTYDRRFVEEEQVIAVADLLSSIQNKDAGLYRKTTLDFYADYQMEVYQADDMDAMMELFHSNIAAQTGEDYSFKMVLINDISANRDKGGLAEAIVLLNGISGDDGKFSDKIEDAWDMTLEWDVTYDGGAKYTVVEEEHVYVFKTADGIFAVM